MSENMKLYALASAGTAMLTNPMLPDIPKAVGGLTEPITDAYQEVKGGVQQLNNTVIILAVAIGLFSLSRIL